jgi:hypothetical protein
MTASQDTQGASTAVMNGITLSIGGTAMTTNGNTLTLASGGLVLISSGTSSTVAFPNAVGTAVGIAAPARPAAAIFVIGGTTYTALENTIGASTATLDGVALRVGGPAITVAGEVVSLGKAGIVIVGGGGTSTVGFSDTSVASLQGTAGTGIGSKSAAIYFNVATPALSQGLHKLVLVWALFIGVAFA